MAFNRFISYLLHPISFPSLGALFYLFVLPRYVSDEFKFFILSIVFVGTFIIPILLLGVLKKAKMITSFHLTTVEERKYPLLLFAFLAILVGRLLFKASLVDGLALHFIAGGLDLLVVYGFLWVKTKVSIHTLGIGSLIGFVIQISIDYHLNLLLVTGGLFVMFGVLAKARIALDAHTQKEVILGVSIGVLAQLLVPVVYYF